MIPVSSAVELADNLAVGTGPGAVSVAGALDQHDAAVLAVAMFAHAEPLPRPREEELASAAWSVQSALSWHSAWQSIEYDRNFKESLAPWWRTWTPGRRDVWSDLFAGDSAARAGFVNPHRVDDAAVDHHPLADLVGRWLTDRSSDDDRERLRQRREDCRRVVTELVRNVAEHGERPGRRPDTSLVLCAFDPESLRITVADCGLGIATTARPKLERRDQALDDAELTAALYRRDVPLRSRARNRGLPQLEALCARRDGVALRTTSAGCELRIDREVHAQAVGRPLQGTVTTVVLRLD